MQLADNFDCMTIINVYAKSIHNVAIGNASILRHAAWASRMNSPLILMITVPPHGTSPLIYSFKVNDIGYYFAAEAAHENAHKRH
jgi:hypothetical protein